MAIFRSKAHLDGVKFRPIEQGLTELVATAYIPAGAVLTTSDAIRLAQFGAGTRIHALTVTTDELDTGTNTLTLNVGFLSHNTGAQASNATAYASAATVAQAGGTVRYEPVIATPTANYTLQIVPAANANANTAAGGVKKVTITAVFGPESTPAGLLEQPYDFGRADPAV